MTIIRRKFIVCLTIVVVVAHHAFAQIPTYYQDIEPIIKKNCGSCHKSGGVGPFSLLSYKDVATKARFIAHVTKIKYMPPWKADRTFQSYKNERFLTDIEIETIQQWVTGGIPKGKKIKLKSQEDTVSEQTPDLILSMRKPFTISDKGLEEFRFFSIPTNLKENTFLASIRFVPGNKTNVHHSRIMADTTQKIRGIDGMSEEDPSIKVFQTIPLVDEFLYGWVPGNEGISFPSGTGKRIFKGTDLILNIHYAPASKKQEDKSKILLFFTKTPVKREVNTLILRENNITNNPFIIPAESKKTFYISYRMEKDISLISILPHMHFLGESFKAIAATPNGDAIPLIKIDSWDFKWQCTYVFRNLVKIPAGSVILVQATYNNTAANPSNPNHPPKSVGYGWNTTDEMLNLILYYLDYEVGDEHIEN